MSRIDKIMDKHSVLKNFALPGGVTDGRQGLRPKDNFNFMNFGTVPGKLFAPWTAPSPQNVSSYIAPVQFQRIRHDITLWREAVREAELAILPFRVRMQRLFVDTVLNPHVQACMLRRKQLTMLREFEIVDKKGTVSDDLTQFFQQKWFEDYTELALDSRFYGFTLIQLGDIVNDEVTEIELVRRMNVSPDRRNVALFEYATTGIQFDDPVYSKWLVWVPTASEIGVSKCGYGMLYKIANYELYHRQTFQQNADYCEMFVHPFRLAKTNKLQGQADRMKLEEMLAQMGSQSWGVIDHNDELEFVSDSTGTGWQSYGDFSKRLEQQITKVLLGHADVMDSTPGRLGSDKGEHSQSNKAVEDVKSLDGTFMQNHVKKSLIPKLTMLGMKGLDGMSLRYKNNSEKIEALEQESSALKVFGEALTQIKNAGYKVDVKQVMEKTGLKLEAVVEPSDPNDEAEFGRAKNIQNRLNILYNFHG